MMKITPNFKYTSLYEDPALLNTVNNGDLRDLNEKACTKCMSFFQLLLLE